MLEDTSGVMKKIGYSAIAINLYLLFGGILGDPGVKSVTYLHYSKNWFSEGKDLYTSDEEESSNEEKKEQNDLESSSDGNTLSNRR